MTGPVPLPTGPTSSEGAGASRDLALRAATGDLDAVAELVRLTSQRVWRTCAFLVDRATADDLTQETYLRAVRSLRSYRGEADPIRWLLTIARRVCAGEIASRQRRRAITARSRDEYRTSTTEPSLGAEMTEAIAGLSLERREAFLLTAVAGYPYAEAAVLCGCPVGTIRSRVARARTDLLAALGLLERHLPDVDDPTGTVQGAENLVVPMRRGAVE